MIMMKNKVLLPNFTQLDAGDLMMIQHQSRRRRRCTDGKMELLIEFFASFFNDCIRLGCSASHECATFFHSFQFLHSRLFKSGHSTVLSFRRFVRHCMPFGNSVKAGQDWICIFKSDSRFPNDSVRDLMLLLFSSLLHQT